MAIITTDNQHYTNIANAIRDKAISTETYTPAQMAAAIQAIPYESYTLVPASETEDLVIPIDDDVTMVAVYIEEPKGFAEYGIAMVGMFWVRPAPLGSLLVSMDPSIVEKGYVGGGTGCAVTSDSITIDRKADAPLVVGETYRVVKVRGKMTENAAME